jgi:hypothetical protein
MATTVRLHAIAYCLERDCPFEADGPDADAQAHRHSDTRAKRGGAEHATATRTHPTTRCAQEGCNP